MLDLLARRYHSRPSLLLRARVADVGFDVAVALLALKHEADAAKKAREESGSGKSMGTRDKLQAMLGKESKPK